MKNATCRNGLAQLGVNFGLTNAQIQEAMDGGNSRDINQIKNLTPEQIAWLDEQILTKKGLAPIMFSSETWGDKIYNESSNNGNDGNPALVGGGTIATNPGYPPNDNNNNDDDDKKDQEKDSSKSNRDPRDRIQHEDYKDELRAKMEKPDVKDSELKNIMDDLYRPNAKIGSGSNADVVRYEAPTGQNVGGKLHLEKAKNYVKALESWLKRNPTASSADRAAAENVLRDLQNALRGK